MTSFLTPSARRESLLERPIVVTYERFLERKAWRDKIALDFELIGSIERDLGWPLQRTLATIVETT